MSTQSQTKFKKRGHVGLIDDRIEPFVNYLCSRGYAQRTLRKRRRAVKSFARWVRDKKLVITDLNESHTDEFLKRSPRSSKDRFARERAAVRMFLRFLRDGGEVAPLSFPTNLSPVDEFKKSYIDYLRNEQGLSERSVYVYLPFVGAFLTEILDQNDCTDLKKLNAKVINKFLLDHAEDCSSEYRRLQAVALRSFLRFAFLCGEVDSDLSLSVPTVSKWRQATVYPYLSPEDVNRILSAVDTSTERGRRDHAVLLLLAQLGLRGSEVVGLKLDDIHWRAGELTVHGKGRIVQNLPLPSDVGKAIALYLRKDRGDSASRKVFLRAIAPRVGFSGPTTIGHIVRRAFAKAGLSTPFGTAAHIFRYSLATRMIRQGATIPEISEVLRHRSQDTTAIYAKVAFETLKDVARPWPIKGGEK